MDNYFDLDVDLILFNNHAVVEWCDEEIDSFGNRKKSRPELCWWYLIWEHGCVQFDSCDNINDEKKARKAEENSKENGRWYRN